MSRRRWIGLAVMTLAVSTLMLWAAARPRVPDLDQAERVTLISVDGGDHRERDPPAGEALYGYPVLGRIEFTDPEQMRELIAALREGMAAPDVQQAKCFWPRHVLRVEQGGRMADYVICFRCQNYELYVNGVRQHTYTRNFSRQVRPVFDKPLVDARVPIAPE